MQKYLNYIISFETEIFLEKLSGDVFPLIDSTRPNKYCFFQLKNKTIAIIYFVGLPNRLSKNNESCLHFLVYYEKLAVFLSFLISPKDGSSCVLFSILDLCWNVEGVKRQKICKIVYAPATIEKKSRAPVPSQSGYSQRKVGRTVITVV